MVVEIDRSILVKEPWITVKNGEVVVRPAIISSISHLPRGHRVGAGESFGGDPGCLYRVVDEGGPCYEFIAVATLDDCGIALNIESEVKILR
ncbi:MAG: hypothetical protein R3C24_11610 [Cyanobacteriota/Melainabacteria group bacterium]|nr:hypothetical protein [Candidatus Obscuribacterales bacterium]